jgi:hypothetical protein
MLHFVQPAGGIRRHWGEAPPSRRREMIIAHGSSSSFKDSRALIER